MDASSSFICHGVYGLEDLLGEDHNLSIFGGGSAVSNWCHAGAPLTSPQHNNGSSNSNSTNTNDAHNAAIERHACKLVMGGIEIDSLFDCRQEGEEGDDDESENDQENNSDSIVCTSSRRCSTSSIFDEDAKQERQSFRIFSSEADGDMSTTMEADGGGDNDDHDHRQGPIAPSGSFSLPLPQDSSLPDVVLGEDIMEELQEHLPLCKRGESFWLQYSLVRDGASLDILLDKVRDSEHTILAIETLEGEIFGAFCSRPWKQSHDYFGSGQSFLWRVQQQQEQQEPSDSSTSLNNEHDDEKESDPAQQGVVQVFKFAFCNQNVQLCQPDRLIVGGGGGGNANNPPPSLPCLTTVDSSSTSSSDGSMIPPTSVDASHGGVGSTKTAPTMSTAEWGFGLWLEHDLLRGSSSPCLTFQSPSLSRSHEDGSLFEIRNLEVWSLTPCISVEQALHNQRQRRLLSGAALVPHHRPIRHHLQNSKKAAAAAAATSRRSRHL